MLITFNIKLIYNGNFVNVDELKTLFKTPRRHVNTSSNLEKVSQCTCS